MGEYEQSRPRWLLPRSHEVHRTLSQGRNCLVYGQFSSFVPGCKDNNNDEGARKYGVRSLSRLYSLGGWKLHVHGDRVCLPTPVSLRATSTRTSDLAGSASFLLLYLVTFSSQMTIISPPPSTQYLARTDTSPRFSNEHLANGFE